MKNRQAELMIGFRKNNIFPISATKPTNNFRLREILWTLLLFFSFWPNIAYTQPTAPEQLSDITIQLKWYHHFQFAGYYAALEQGYYREEGLNVSLIEGGPDVPVAKVVTAGEADFGVLGSELILDRIQGKPLVLLAVIFQHSTRALMVREDSGIVAPSDLVGKPFMLNIPESAEFWAMFEREGLPHENLDVIQKDRTAIAQLISGKIAAMNGSVGDQPFVLQQQNVPIHLIRPIDYGIDFYGDSLFTSEEFLEKHPEQVAAIRRATLRGWEYAMSHVEEIITLIISKYTPNIDRERLHFEAESMRALIMPELVEVGHVNPGRIRRIAETYAELGLAPKGYNLKGFLFEPEPLVNLQWIWWVVGAMLLVVALIGAGASILVAFNRRLREEVGRRTQELSIVNRELQESEARLHTLIDTLPDLVWLKDSAGIYLACNHHFEDFFGATEDEIVGKTDYDFVDKELADFFREKDREAMAAGKALVNEEELTYAKDGHTESVETIKTPMYDIQSKLVGVLGVGRDITDRKLSETALRQSEATIRNKLKAIVEPEGDLGILKLADIIDTEILQSIMEDFYQLTGMVGAVLDITGEVLVAVGWQNICTKFHRCHPDTLKNCLESDTVLTRDVPEGTFKAYRCKNNMWDMVTPLMVGGRHVGNIFIGQFFYDDERLDVELFRQQAHRYGFDEQEYLAALEQVPHFSHEKVDACIQFFSKIAKLISTLSFSTIQQSRLLAERTLAVEQLSRTQEQLNFTLTRSGIGAWDLNLMDHSSHRTPSHDLIFGYETPLQNWTYEMFLEHVLPEDRAMVDQKFQEAIATQTDWWFECRILRHDGEQRWIWGAGGHKQNSEEKSLRMSGVVQDITDRKIAEVKIVKLLTAATDSRRTLLSVVEDHKLAEEEIRTLNAELEQRVIARTAQLEAANKELEAFSYSVSHDLRAPLRAVDGYTSMLTEDYGSVLDEEGLRICSVISEGARDMGRLIDDLLSFSRFGRATIEPAVIDMMGLARAVFFELTTPEKRKRVDFILSDLPECVGDPSLMRQVWVNLLSNALKFSINRERPVIEVSVLHQDDEVIYCVRDNGAGFDMRYVNKLFGVFQRLHSTKEFIGTGVGLAIVQRIIVRHGGRIWAEGQVEKGARFYFTLKQGANHG